MIDEHVVFETKNWCKYYHWRQKHPSLV